jgi:hypothetical protein
MALLETKGKTANSLGFRRFSLNPGIATNSLDSIAYWAAYQSAYHIVVLLKNSVIEIEGKTLGKPESQHLQSRFGSIYDLRPRKMV